MANTDFTKKIYLVGGAVRDALLGLPVKDKDYVAVGFHEEDFKHLHQVGKNFPVFLQDNGYQIALARREKKTQHGYNGFSIDTQQVTLYEDLKRRDLTINAIALDEQTQIYHDPFNGIQDLNNKVLRHVSEMFCEDPLRVLRIARFRAKLGSEWTIHPSTQTLIYQMRDELKFLEANRVYKEVKNALLEQNSYLFFETLLALGVLDNIFPNIFALSLLEGRNPHQLSAFAHTMEVLKHVACKKLPEKYHLILQFAALYHEIATLQNFKRTKETLDITPLLDIAIPNTLKTPMLLLIQNHTTIYRLPQMHPRACVAFFESYKRDSTLLKLQILLAKSCTNNPKNTPQIEESKLLETFKALNAYSPKNWIAQNQPSPDAIRKKVLHEKAKICEQILHA